MEIDQEWVEQIRSLVRTDAIKVSDHAFKQMNIRGIRLCEAIDAILHGKCFWQERSEGYLHPKFSFASKDGSITAVAAGGIPVVLVTVFPEK